MKNNSIVISMESIKDKKGDILVKVEKVDSINEHSRNSLESLISHTLYQRFSKKASESESSDKGGSDE